MFPKDMILVREATPAASQTANFEDIDKVFTDFINPWISALRSNYPEYRIFNVSVHVRTCQVTTFPSVIIDSAPFCNLDPDSNLTFWLKVAEEARNRGYKADIFPTPDKPSIVSFTKFIKDNT